MVQHLNFKIFFPIFSDMRMTLHDYLYYKPKSGWLCTKISFNHYMYHRHLTIYNSSEGQPNIAETILSEEASGKT